MFSKILIFAGLLLIGISLYLYQMRLTPVRLKIKSYKNVQNASMKESLPASKAEPLLLEIPELKIKLPIVPAKINDGKWETTSEGVSYLATSPIPGETGNSILYGHNWEKLLGRLIDIKPNAKIIITYTDGTTTTFIVEYTGTVKPDQIGILNQTTDKRITVYTCTGFLDSMRFIVVAFPEDETNKQAMN